MPEMKYWLFGRVKDGARYPVLIGSYDQYDYAIAVRNKSKAVDFDVSTPILAESEDDARKKVDLHF